MSQFQINFCSSCGFHFPVPNCKFCNNCGCPQLDAPSNSRPQPQSVPKKSKQKSQNQPKVCSTCRSSPPSGNFGMCQSCYENKTFAQNDDPQCNMCDRKAHYNKTTGEYSSVCTKHYYTLKDYNETAQ